MPYPCLPVFSAASRVVPLPVKASRTAGFFSKPVVGDHIGSYLRGIEMVYPNGGDVRHADGDGRSNSELVSAWD